MTQTIPISKTKIIPPRRRSELLTRKRLVDVLNDGLDKKLTLISAPAGYGKTSLLIDLIDQSEFTCCWLALDELDIEPQRFFAYFISAISEQFPQFGGQSKSELDAMSSLEDDMEKLVVKISNEIFASIPEHFVFIIDDFHLVEGVQPIRNFIERFIRLMGENCHLFISSRKLIALNETTLLTARNQVIGLSFAELAFLPEELQALLSQNKKLHITDKQAQELIDETEGWITGLQYSNADVLPKGSTGSAVNDGAAIYRYFESQVLGRQSQEMRDFIVRTAMFDEFDAKLCASVLAPFYPEDFDWQGCVQSITNNNMFALPVGENGRWMRYHHLFRDFLRDHCTRERPKEIPQILARLVETYEKLGEWEKAHQACKKLGDIDQLAALIERAAPNLFNRAFFIVEAWIKDLPPQILNERPGLISSRGAMISSRGQHQEGIKLFDIAETIQRKNNDMEGLSLTIARRAMANRSLGNLDDAINDVNEVISITEAEDSMQSLYANAFRVKGLILHRMGSFSEAVPCFEKALEIYTRIKDNSNIPTLLLETGMSYHAVGNYRDTENSYKKAFSIAQQDGDSLLQASLSNNMGVLYHSQGRYADAINIFEEGLIHSRNIGIRRFEILISLSLGDLFSELEDFVLAEQRYKRAQDIFQGTDEHFYEVYLMFSQVNLALLRKDVKTAKSILDENAGSIASGGSEYEKGAFALLSGRLSLINEQYANALDEIKMAGDYYLKEGREHEAGPYHVWYAAVLFQTGNHAEAAEHLQKAYETHRQNIHPIVVVCHQAQEWLSRLQKQPIISRTIRELFTQAGRFTSQISETRHNLRRHLDIVDVPASYLTIHGFGQARASIGGQQVASWITQSVREMFFYFLSQSAPVTKEQVVDLLWPEVQDQKKLNLKFKNNLYRLRTIVGQETIHFDGSSYYTFNRSIDYEYDVDAFKAHVARAGKSEDEKEKISLLQKAVDLVDGTYLNDIYKDWAAPDRERLNVIYMNALETLASLYLAHAELDKSMRTCQLAIVYDPAFEPAYQITMRIYHRQGDNAGIKRTYQACCDALKQRYDISPSPETEEIYNSLTK